jgi:hypothetical protein
MTEDLKALIQRVAALEDIAAIKDLKYNYWNHLDGVRLEQVRDCFVAQGAIIDMEGIPRCEDREAFLTIVKAQAGKPGSYNMHHGHNARIKITGPDSAEGKWDSYYYGIDTVNRTTIQLSGEYDDVYVRAGGRWWIKSLRFVQTSFMMQTVDDKGQIKVVSLGKPDPNAFT